jgi:hypothetical protein
MIGSGIFIVSADIARTVQSPFLLLLAWVLTGVITLLGALAYGELAAMYPRAGGQYVFLREAMGPGGRLPLRLDAVRRHPDGHHRRRWRWRSAASRRALAGITPDAFAWFPQADVCVAWLGCRDAATRPSSSASPAAPRGAAQRVAAHRGEPARRARGQGRADRAHVVKTGALALLIVLGLTVGRTRPRGGQLRSGDASRRRRASRRRSRSSSARARRARCSRATRGTT